MMKAAVWSLIQLCSTRTLTHDLFATKFLSLRYPARELYIVMGFGLKDNQKLVAGFS